MIRVALVGCGGISHLHRNALLSLRDRVQVSVTVDTIEERARRAAEELGADTWTNDYRKAPDRCDAAILALPHHLHHPVGMEFLTAGKHVLMEKPLANTEEECLQLIEASEAAGTVLMVGYCMRFHPLVLKLREILRSGEYGVPFHISLWTEQHTEVAQDSWIADPEKLGGGQLFSHGCHYVDLLLYFLGAPVAGVHMGTNLGTPWMKREGTSDLILKFDNGALGYHGATWGARGSRLGYAIHAHTPSGMLEADLSRGRLSLLRCSEETVLAETGPTVKYGQAQLRHFLDCIERKTRPITDGPDSLTGLRVIWRLYEAERLGQVADLRGLRLAQADRTP